MNATKPNDAAGANAQRAGPDAPAPSPEALREALKIGLDEHGIGFHLPSACFLRNARLELSCGALITGTLIGDLVCTKGSVVVEAEGRVMGNIEADRIYVQGDVVSSRERRSLIHARHLAAVADSARVNADIRSKAFSIQKNAKIWGRLITLEEGPAMLE